MNQNEYIYGLHSVKAILQIHPQQLLEIYTKQKHSSQIEEILQILPKNKIQVRFLSQQELDLLAPNANHQGIVAKIKNMPNYNEADLTIFLDQLQENALLLILDSVQDPHNLGACLRTANAAGAHAIIAPKDKAVGITPIVRKVASGAAETTPFFAVTNLARTLETLKARGIWLFGTDAQAEQSIYQVDLKGSIALVLGAEGTGLRRLTQEKCDFLVSIPLFGTVSSLNVSVATGICLFEAVRQRTA